MTPLALENSLRHDITHIAGTIGERNLDRYEALKAAENYIVQRFEAAGQRVARQVLLVNGKEVANLEVEWKGQTEPDAIIVIGAHYDSVRGCPGANDNGSGVAALLAAAEAFATRTPRKTLRLVAFVNEEPPYFQGEAMGSLVYARRAKAQGERIEAMLSLETMGYFSDRKDSQKYPFPLNLVYPDKGNFIGLVANRSSSKLLNQVAKAFEEARTIPFEKGAFMESLPGVGWSDHWAFWQAGYPALMITDTAPFRYPYYHTQEDTPEKVDYPRLGQVTRALFKAIERLAFEP
ncbi:M28 family peptidase [Oligoflexus tunisiensis]|uniref:M28 family peptidase n=1 Tax=Oligoflexus tunisiensis TaxID=708132 RepID=UPI000B2F61DF|nr:M28 family peptidase [Oligoflexus tunisiensis]